MTPNYTFRPENRDYIDPLYLVEPTRPTIDWYDFLRHMDAQYLELLGCLDSGLL